MILVDKMTTKVLLDTIDVINGQFPVDSDTCIYHVYSKDILYLKFEGGFFILMGLDGF